MNADSVVLINAMGVDKGTSERVIDPAQKDHTTYFGSYTLLNESEPDKLDKLDRSKLKLNDVILPKSEGFGEQHFMIKYLPEKNFYILKDCGDGTGTFIKI